MSLQGLQCQAPQTSNSDTRLRPTTQGSCQSCGALSDHTNVPEVAQCNNAQGQYMTVAHTQQAGHVTTGTR